MALRQQKIRRHNLERELAREKRKVRSEEQVRAARAEASGSDSAGGSLFAPGASGSFQRLAASVPAELGLAVTALGGSGQGETFGSLQSGHAWSTIKVPILVTLMRERALSAEEERLATAAIEVSDNEAAAALFDQLEEAHGGLMGASSAVQGVLAASGDTGTTVATAPPPEGAVSTYGQTEWSAAASADFFRALANECLLGAADTEYVLGLMRSVTPEQRWGLGQAGFDSSWLVGIKGGWGPEAGSGGYLVRQAGVVEDGASGVAVAIIVRDPSGSFGAGVTAVDEVATWLRENLRGLGAPAKGC